MLASMGGVLEASTSTVVTVSGGTSFAGGSWMDIYAYIKVDQDGKIYKKDGVGSWVQISTSTDWVRPVSAAPGDYYVRYTGATGDTGFLGGTTASGVWHPLATSDWQVWVYDDNALPGLKSVTLTIEIKLGSGGATLDTGSYILTAEREDV